MIYTRTARVLTFAVIVGIVAVLIIAFAPVAVLELDLSHVRDDRQLKHVADTRTSFVQLIGGLAAAVTAYFAWRNLVRSSADSTRAESEALMARRQATDTRIAESYVRACDQLGRDSQAVRAGGALALGRLLRGVDDLADYWAIMDVLTTFVRHRAAINPEPASRTRPEQDVEAALNVLARRTATRVPNRTDDSPTDLSGCDLSGAWLAGGTFSGGYFGGTVLRNANFTDADVSDADFDRADLTNADFMNAKVKNADFRNANIFGARFDGTDLASARLSEEQRKWWEAENQPD